MQGKMETDSSGTRPQIPGVLQHAMGPMIPHQMQPNMIYPHGTPVIPHQNYNLINQMGYNPHYIPPYQTSNIPGYTANMMNVNYSTPSNINTKNNVSPNSSSTTVQANAENKTSHNETKSNKLNLLLFMIFEFINIIKLYKKIIVNLRKKRKMILKQMMKRRKIRLKKKNPKIVCLAIYTVGRFRYKFSFVC